MLLRRTTEPAAEPVTLAEVKAHLRVLHTSEDTAIAMYAKAARRHIEEKMGRAIITQTWTAWLSGFPDGDIVLPRPPLIAVSHIRYLDTDSATQTFSSASYHVLDEGTETVIELADGASWPDTAVHPRAVTIEYQAGYGAASTNVPDDIRAAILMQTEHLYYNRGMTAEKALSLNPMAVDALIGPYKTHGWI